MTDFLYPFARTTVLEDAWFDIFYSPVRDEEGRIVAVLRFIVETTERVLAERRQREADAALRKSEEHLALAVGIAGLGHWELALGTKTLTSSARCRANFGRPAQAPFTYEDLIASIHPDDRERQQRAVAAAIETRSDLDIEYRILPLRANCAGSRFAGGSKRATTTGLSAFRAISPSPKRCRRRCAKTSGSCDGIVRQPLAPAAEPAPHPRAIA